MSGRIICKTFMNSLVLLNQFSKHPSWGLSERRAMRIDFGSMLLCGVMTTLPCGPFAWELVPSDNFFRHNNVIHSTKATYTHASVRACTRAHTRTHTHTILALFITGDKEVHHNSLTSLYHMYCFGDSFIRIRPIFNDIMLFTCL